MSYVQNETIRALRERKALTQKPLHLLRCLGQQRLCAEWIKLYP